MKLSDLREHWEIIRDEALALESTYIQETPRPTGKWVANDPGGEIWKILKKYQDGESGWLKSGKDDVPSRWEDWINFPLVWKGHELLGNCRVCPRTVELIRQIPGVSVAGFSLMRGGVKLDPHCDPLEDDYLCTYHLGLRVPDGCVLHHSVVGSVTEADGKHIAFDGRQEHWAENRSSEDRIILYIEYVLHK